MERNTESSCSELQVYCLSHPALGFDNQQMAIILNYENDSPFLYQYDVVDQSSTEANQIYPVFTPYNSFLSRNVILLHFIM